MEYAYPLPTQMIEVKDRSQVALARRTASQRAQHVGFSASREGSVAIAATEIATNLVKHAGGGEILVTEVHRGDGAGIELLSLDNGPGMADVGACLRDGYSTSGSMGSGLGAVMRLVQEVDIFSAPGLGTAMLTRLWAGDMAKRAWEPALDVGAVCLAKPGEVISGDGFLVQERQSGELIVVVDGLGHGPIAGEASLEALRVAREHADRSPAEIVERVHAALQSTRGAAVAVARLHADREEVDFCGLGNISASILTAEGSRSMVSHNGTAGHQVYKIQQFTYPFPEGALVVLFSDGLKGRWNIEAYPGLLFRHPGLVAGILYRDFNRGRDDLTVVAARRRQK